MDEDFIIADGEQFDPLFYALPARAKKFDLFYARKIFDGLTDGLE